MVSIGWALLTLIGSTWFYAGDYALLLGMYWNAPAIALLILGAAPARMWSNNVCRTALMVIALVGSIRAIHALVSGASTSGGFDLSSALVQVISLMLLLLLVWVGNRRMVSGTPGASAGTNR